MRLRTKQIRFLYHIGHASHRFHINGLGCVDKRESRRILGRGRKRLFLFHTAPAPVRMYTDYGRSRRNLISLCYQYLNLGYTLCNMVRIWGKRFVRRFSDKARNIEGRKENPELDSERIVRMMVNKDSLYSVFMLRRMYIFKGKYTFTNNFPTACRMSTY
jgi:hypothetical protein